MRVYSALSFAGGAVRKIELNMRDTVEQLTNESCCQELEDLVEYDYRKADVHDSLPFRQIERRYNK